MFDPSNADFLDEFCQQLDEASFQDACDRVTEAVLRASGYGIAPLSDLRWAGEPPKQQ